MPTLSHPVDVAPGSSRGRSLEYFQHVSFHDEASKANHDAIFGAKPDRYCPTCDLLPHWCACTAKENTP